MADDAPHLHLAREIVNVGPTPSGCVVLTTFSQAQIDELLAQQGWTDWVLNADSSELTLVRTHPDVRPLATFDLRRGTHRQALRDALAGGTIHLCAIESLNADTGMLIGQKIALALEAVDRLIIATALGDNVEPRRRTTRVAASRR
jgi:hypothetical protein